jgi:hypothetical protein
MKTLAERPRASNSSTPDKSPRLAWEAMVKCQSRQVR